MADLSQTADNVVAGSNAEKIRGTAGDSLTAGMPAYKDTSDNNHWKPADCNVSDLLAGSAGFGIVLNPAADGQPVEIQLWGDINVGATLAVGTVYVVSATAGKLAPQADLTSGQRITLAGIASSTSNLKMLRPAYTGAAVP